jgi:hypothetical protein
MSAQQTGVWGELIGMPFRAIELFKSHFLSEKGGKVLGSYTIGFLTSVLGTPSYLHSYLMGFLLLRSWKAHL